MQPLIWERVIYNKEDLSNIRYVCGHCGVISAESVWKENFNKGKYIHEHPTRKTKGFHLNALASTLPGASWEKVAEEYILAAEELEKGNFELMKVWVNTEMGLPWEMNGEELDADKLEERKEGYGAEVPQKVICLTCGVDTQDDRFEAEVVGWGVGKESWGIKYARIYGDLKQDEIWNALDDFLKQTFTKADGTKLNIICTCIDSGGHFSNEVFKFTKARNGRRVFAIRGVAGYEKPYIPQISKNNRYKAPMFNIGVDTGKSIVQDRLQIETQGSGYCHFPNDPAAGYDKAYFKGLTAERQVVTYRKGRAVYTWELKKGVKRNEPFDIRNYATAALEIASPVLKESEAGTATMTATKQKRGRRVRSSGVSV